MIRYRTATQGVVQTMTDAERAEYDRGFADGLLGKQTEPRTFYYKVGWADGDWSRRSGLSKSDLLNER